jgi:transcriptional regulator with XRE-family HTH domain
MQREDKSKMDGAQIRAYRQKLGLSQTQLGQAFGMAANTIARWERGELIPQWPKLLSLGFRALEQDLRRSRTNKETWKLRRAATISPQELLAAIEATTPRPGLEELARTKR